MFSLEHFLMMHQAVKQKYLVLEHRNTCVSYNNIISTRFSEQFYHQMFPKTIFSTETKSRQAAVY